MVTAVSIIFESTLPPSGKAIFNSVCDLKLNVIEYLYGFKDLQMTILSKKRSLL